jgi:hypothetical protein
LPEYKHVADLHKDTGINSMVYFELTFGERRKKTLSKNFDQYVYQEMHEWLKYKPMMTPPHFRDLMNPNDGNYRPPREEEDVHEDGLEPLPRSLVLETDPSFEAYASVAAYDAAGAFLEYSDDASLDIEVSGGATRSLWRSPPTFSSAAAVRPLGEWGLWVEVALSIIWI